MTLSYGSGEPTVTMEGPFGSVGMGVKLVSFTASADAWKGAVSPYSQQVSIPWVSRLSKVDLQLDWQSLEKLHQRDLSFTAENEEGIVTLYAIGDKPLEDLNFQATLTEVSA